MPTWGKKWKEGPPGEKGYSKACQKKGPPRTLSEGKRGASALVTKKTEKSCLAGKKGKKGVVGKEKAGELTPRKRCR